MKTQNLMSADQKRASLLVAAQYPIADVDVSSSCTTYNQERGITFKVTSSGNDPVCEDANTSSVRFTFATP
jgi:hypothetical protein